MEIKRDIINQLRNWKLSTNRKPLVLQGARQVGKTWLLKHFGEQEFESIAYFNFDGQSELKQFFATTKDTDRIIKN
jgi:predicted AAA+ superfamily ATPase